MCTFFSWVLDLLAALAVVFFGWFGWVFLFQPTRYLRAFAEIRLDNFRRWGLSEDDVARRPPAVLYHWFTRRSYREWLESLAAHPHDHRGLLWLVRLGGLAMGLLCLLMAAALVTALTVQVGACF